MPGKIELSAKTVIDALRAEKGNISAAGRRLRVSRYWIHDYINKHTTVKQALDDIRESAVDVAEASLEERMMESDTLLIFFLRTRGASRGYAQAGDTPEKPLHVKQYQVVSPEDWDDDNDGS